MSSILLLGLLIHVLALSFIPLGGRMDAPCDVMSTPMVDIGFLKRSIVLGT